MALRTAVAAPFRHMHRDRLRRPEFIYFLAIDRRWMNRDQAGSLITIALREGLLQEEGGVLVPSFNPAEVEIPLGFRPSEDIFLQGENYCDTLMVRIAEARGMSQQEVAAEIHSIISEQFDGRLLPEAGAVILARKYAVPFEDLIEKLRESLSGSGC
ncbi:DUF2240 family protein [Methanogenium marinum]|uniref:DUF2240 family protein n=1 Tax=Methanogenium marinum TaxID=348610 RepID=A0A9Q4KV80_9EURY|nr:DUF2240 family protein [Methanogenium marinum]MDE4908085.1 DUF2240 family protein [Methanogenium marinum]